MVDPRWDSISCVHFKKAHELIEKNDITTYVQVVDYPILQYISEKSTCNQMDEHGIEVNELKYFVWVIIGYTEED